MWFKDETIFWRSSKYTYIELEVDFLDEYKKFWKLAF